MRTLPLLMLLLATATASAAPKKKLTFADFWTVAGVTRTDTAETIAKKWGKPKEDKVVAGERTLRFTDGPSVTLRASGGIMIDMLMLGDAFVKAHPDAATSLLGQTCAVAGARLAFYKKGPVPGYLTCKHYDKNGYFIDVTLMCSKTVSTVVVVWEPMPPEVKASPLPDHC
jgi:hypothetical protein